MKYCFYIFLILLCIHDFSPAQLISIKIAGIDFNKTILHSLQGEKTFFVDSITSPGKDQFTYQFDPNKHHRGIYRITFNKNKWLDFIYDNEEVIIETNAGNIPDSLKVIKSISNKLFYEFIKLNKAYKTKTELLQIILARYPKDDDYFTVTLNKLTKLQKEYLDFVKIKSQKNQNSFIAGYIRSSQLPVVDMTLPPERQLAYLKSHSLDNVDFSNSKLIYSDAFTNKSIEYLTYYRNPQLTKEFLEKEFMTAVDTILNKAKVHQLVYQQIAEYLIDGFKKFGFDRIIDYMIQNYVIKDDLCLDEKTENSIQKRLDQNKRFPIGTVVPNIVLSDTSDNGVSLANIKTNKVLVLFYSSSCPHCQDLIPKLSEVYLKQNEKKFEVLAVSMDTKRKDWTDFIKKNNLTWLNVSDLKGWDSKAASDFYIYATPTMFLLDKERKIIAKPITFSELQSVL